MSDDHSHQRPPPEDARTEGPPSGHEESAPSEEQIDFDEALSGLQEIESSRRLKGTIAGITVFVLVGLAIFAIYEFRTFLFRPDLPVEQGERELLDKTDDPECRNMIAQVTDIRNRFFELEPVIEQNVPTGPDARRREIAERLDELVTQLDRAESLSHRATFRFEHSPSEVDSWFRYTRGQLLALRDLVRPDANGDTGVSGPTTTDAGDNNQSDTGTTESISSRRNDLLFTTHRSFVKFRVWHTSEQYSHPCGPADEMESPWRPNRDAGGGVASPDTNVDSPALDPASSK